MAPLSHHADSTIHIHVDIHSFPDTAPLILYTERLILYTERLIETHVFY